MHELVGNGFEMLKKPSFKYLAVISIVWFLSNHSLANDKLVPVKIAISESLSLSNSSSSERYKSALESALYFTIGETSKKLSTCGYTIQATKEYFDSDNIKSAEIAGKNLYKGEVWAFFGPRRSDHFLSIVTETKDMVAISPMGETKNIHDLKAPIFTMYASSFDLASKAFQEAKEKNYGEKYAGIIDTSCRACREFFDNFENISKSKMKNVFSENITGEEPNLESTLNKLKTNPVDFIIVPNYSKTSSYIISNISKAFPKIKFIGANGWGDSNYGFLFKYPISNQAKGFCVRLGGGEDELIRRHSTQSFHFTWQNQPTALSYTPIALIEWIRNLTEDLCKIRPSNKKTFIDAVSTYPKDHYAFNDKVEVFKLENGSLTLQSK